MLGWQLHACAHSDKASLNDLLNVQSGDVHPKEIEEAELLMTVSSGSISDVTQPLDFTLDGPAAVKGTVNRLSKEHHDWPDIERVAAASRETRASGNNAVHSTAVQLNRGSSVATEYVARGSNVSTTRRNSSCRNFCAQQLQSDNTALASHVIRSRRSAVEMDGRTSISRKQFLQMLARTVPALSETPWDAVNTAWATEMAVAPIDTARVHLALFVHRVEGIEPGMYVLCRNLKQLPMLKHELKEKFEWEAVDGQLSAHLFKMRTGNSQQLASQLNCHQNIAAGSAFSLSMLADFEELLAGDGANPSSYRRLFWEAGLVGQVLYLEANAKGVGATGHWRVVLGIFIEWFDLCIQGLDATLMTRCTQCGYKMPRVPDNTKYCGCNRCMVLQLGAASRTRGFVHSKLTLTWHKFI